ncbi:MAG: hypothetical protein QOJ94_3229 [Sphingomonadales bacterium]|nr:hypothetical protein [Sphingomonadales bacterium]MEA3063448.1 hypothetical protein [Sphingomonadales bacterium]
MASIENLHLEIFEQSGFAVAKVHYQIRGSQQDVLLKRRYREIAELIGDDTGAGEDGVSEPIPDGIIVSTVMTFTGTAPITRDQRIPLPSKALDEDPSGPIAAIPVEDEILAQVTLTPITVPQVSALSNVVRRGGPVNSVSAVPA